MDWFRPEVEVLHGAGEPLVLGEEAGEVEGEQAREEKRTNETFPSLQQTTTKRKNENSEDDEIVVQH